MTNNVPKISVVVPIYNVEKYLPRCIESILKQTFADFELILVDDGSPDNCGKICDEYAQKDSRIKVIHNQNQGVSGARKCGVENAVCEWICFVDSDDYIPQNSLQCFISNSNDCDMVLGGSVFYGENNEEKKHTPMAETIDRDEYIKRLLMRKINIVPWARIIKRQLLDENIMSIPKEIVRTQDFILNTRLSIKLSCVKIISDIVYCYCGREDSTCRTFIPDEAYIKKLIRYVIQPYKDNGLDKKFKKEIVYTKIRMLHVFW